MKTHYVLHSLRHRNTAHDEHKENTLQFTFRLIEVLKNTILILHYNQLIKNHSKYSC